jgi:acetyl-CoA carboxylase biotin carboxyl carrier protein
VNTLKKSISNKTQSKKKPLATKAAALISAKKKPSSVPSFDLIKEYTDFMKENDLVEMDFQSNEVSIRLRRFEAAPVSAPMMQVSAASAVGSKAAPAPASVPVPVPVPQTGASPVRSEDIHVVKSPFVGTFYRSPGPNQEPFVQEGKTVSVGDTLCIVEAMKLMNEIESDIKGRVVRVLVKDGTPVEFGEALFEIEKI